MSQGERIRAGGGVLWRRGQTEPEVAIVHRPRYDDWSLPKGKLRDGEHPLLGAYREVIEETGIEPVVGRRLPSQEYRLGPDRKIVDYWAMTPREARAEDPQPGPSSDLDPATAQPGFVPNDEVDGLRWLRLAEAASWLSYQRDRDLVRAFAAVPPPSATVVLVRHGRAGDRSAWSGPDHLRPLDPVGQAQAEVLREALSLFAPQRILAADNLRCIATVTPLAEQLGLSVEPEPTLSEDHYQPCPGRGLDRVRSIIRRGGRVVLCSQGGVIPHLVSTLAGAEHPQLAKVPARKASIWTLSFVEDRVVAADYYPDIASSAAPAP